MVVSSATLTDIYVPSNAGDGISLVLHSEITRQDYVFDVKNITDMPGYYHFIVDFTDVPEGEYRYTLGGDTGVIRIGEFKVRNTNYKSKEKDTFYEYKG